MNFKKITLFLTFVLLLSITPISSQSVIPASGGNSSGVSGTVSYSVGQIFFSTYVGSNGSSIQGVQQPYEISVVIGLEEANEISLECIVFPNPTHEFIKLKVQSYKAEDLSYQIFDIHGKLLEKKEIITTEVSIPMSTYIPAIYFLKILHGQKEIKTFKIIKN